MRRIAPELLLQRLIEADAADVEVSHWLANAFRQWLASGGTITLPAALGLPPKATTVQRCMRDTWLNEAASLLDGGPWQRAQRLRTEALRFGACQWQRWRSMPLPPADATALEACLHLAFRTGAAMPDSDQAYRNILAPTQAKTIKNLG